MDALCRLRIPRSRRSVHDDQHAAGAHPDDRAHRILPEYPSLTPDEAAEHIVEAIVQQPVRIATRLGIFGQVLHAIVPHVAQIINNTAFRMFPDSSAALKKSQGEKEAPTADQLAFTELMRGVHF